MAENKEAPIVLSGYAKKDNGPAPVFISKDMEDESDAVVLKFDQDDKVSKGFYVDVPDGRLTNVALKNMAGELSKFYKSRGNLISDYDLKLLISGLTSRIVYIPVEEMPLFVSRLSLYFSGNVFYIDRLRDADYLKGCFAACRTPDRLHFFVVNLQHNIPLPNFLVSYVETPRSRIQVKMEEYVNDIFVGKIRLMDNIYIIATGDIDALPAKLQRQYSVWNPKVDNIEKDPQEYKTISSSSFKHMHKVMNPVSDEVWNQVALIEDILSQFGIELTNKDYNHLDDYLVTLINQGVDDATAIEAFIDYRLIPMLGKQVSVKELKRKLNEAGVRTSRKENIYESI